MAVILDAKQIAKGIKSRLKNIVNEINEERHGSGLSGVTLGIVSVGEDPASKAYVKGKRRDCEECGIICRLVELGDAASECEVFEQVKKLCGLSDGVIVQLPLPGHISPRVVMGVIPPSKDVDGFSQDSYFLPCTPMGILQLLGEYDISVRGKKCVVVGRSEIVGRPMARLLTDLDGTVTLCHSKTTDVSGYTKIADIIVCAVGKKDFLTADMVGENAVVVDVGINRDEQGKICGDADYEALSKKCRAITPVPGGVGLMTRAALLENVVKAAKIRNHDEGLTRGDGCE